ncbi:sphingoid base N-palmitoyltransferase [Pelomyxa schiedti]|nr:sphingoid base N-palmitoyltransferase [Pelomyxa schiedti]
MGGPHKETEGNELASLLWEKWPCIPFTMHSTIRAYYVVQLSYHLHSCVQHILRQHKAHCAQMNGGAERIDTWIKSLLRNLFKSAVSGQFDEMLLHHTVALLLIVFSYVQNMLRIGVLVFILHDTCDVLIYAEKLAVDLTRRKAVIVGVYLTLIGTWTWTRLYLFPFVILHASLASAPRVVPLAADRGARLAYATFNGLLVMLMCVHVYWTVLLVRLAWNFVIRGRLRDPHCSCNSVSGNENSKCGGESDGPCCRGTPVQGGLSVSVVNN